MQQYSQSKGTKTGPTTILVPLEKVRATYFGLQTPYESMSYIPNYIFSISLTHHKKENSLQLA